jgi:hypothetical protein
MFEPLTANQIDFHYQNLHHQVKRFIRSHS